MFISARKAIYSAVLGSVITLCGLGWAASADSPVHQLTSTSDTPPSAIEDFTYPNADSILAEKGILLKKGDGSIILADCDDAADQIRVLTVEDEEEGRNGTYCFEASAPAGYLTMEVSRVFALEAADHPISADITALGQTATVNVAKGGWKSVGEGTIGGPESMLVEIRVTG
ncbi:hypothetical protein [Streptomyces sp. NPDC060198]|uniref:hypothetical protein n=1 Tax=Streptomyces sp. NPDC060198 TaxID=3347070 RepID=UPI00364A59E2